MTYRVTPRGKPNSQYHKNLSKKLATATQ